VVGPGGVHKKFTSTVNDAARQAGAEKMRRGKLVFVSKKNIWSMEQSTKGQRGERNQTGGREFIRSKIATVRCAWVRAGMSSQPVGKAGGVGTQK